jgi:hypothetical protein
MLSLLLLFVIITKNTKVFLFLRIKYLSKIC